MMTIDVRECPNVYIGGPWHAQPIALDFVVRGYPYISVYNAAGIRTFMYIRVLWWIGRADSGVWGADRHVIGNDVYRTIYAPFGCRTEELLDDVRAVDVQHFSSKPR